MKTQQYPYFNCLLGARAQWKLGGRDIFVFTTPTWSHTESTAGKFLTRLQDLKNKSARWTVGVHAVNPRTWESEAGKSLSSRPTWFTEGVLEQLGPHRAILFQKQTKQNILCLILARF